MSRRDQTCNYCQEVVAGMESHHLVFQPSSCPGSAGHCACLAVFHGRPRWDGLSKGFPPRTESIPNKDTLQNELSGWRAQFSSPATTRLRSDVYLLCGATR
jgi:hypothetical protein